jgi:hypothetical protein
MCRKMKIQKLNHLARKCGMLCVCLLALTTATTMVKGQGRTKGKVVDSGDSGRAISTSSETSSAKGWNAKVQGNLLVTSLVVTFDSPEDYDNFAGGKIWFNLILNNTLSDQTITLNSRQFMENFRPAPDKRKLTLNLVVDNMSAPLSKASCGEIALRVKSTADCISMALRYSRCGSAPAQTLDNSNGKIISKGGTLAGNLNIMAGDTRILKRAAMARMGREAGVLIISSSKGAGSPKAAGF